MKKYFDGDIEQKLESTDSIEDKSTRSEDQEKQIKKIKRQIIFLIILVIIIGFIFIVVACAAYNSSVETVKKPIIYIYPEEEQEVSISVSNPEKLTTTYPKYDDCWQVIASPNGDLIYEKTGRKLYSLYWEGQNTNVHDMSKGFIVKGEDTSEFLEEKLEILGLNEKESEEFIIYWLPKMEHNEYNYIYFETMEEINNNMALEITPEPETLIRVMMAFKALEEPIEIEEQQLVRVERKGYTVVEIV